MDKKLKKAADKITMPSDMKERIINACELAERNRSNTDNSDGYIDVVSSSERVDSRSRIIRTISAVAACAVLVSGLGATGVFLHRQHGSQMSGSEVMSGSECRSCPFGDFSTFEYTFDAGDGKYGNYPVETYAKLSDFLNKFNWGEPVEKPKNRDNSADVEGQIYDIKWTRGDTPPIDCNIHIANDGYVFYQESMMDFETGAQKTITENSRCYKIDFDAFNSGVQEILAQADAPTPFGDFSEFEYSLDAQDGKFGEYSAETYAKLSDFLNKFNWGVELSMSEAENDDETVLHDLVPEKYTITWTKGDTPPVNCNIYVSKTGYVLYNEDIEYLETDEDHFIECRSYRIDFNAFDSGIQAVLNNEPLEKELSKCEDSPFADILSQPFLAAPFAIENVEMTAAQRNDICSIFDSQTWYEFDGRGEYFGWIITPNRNNFTVTYTEGQRVDVISVGYPNIACIYSRTYDDSGSITDSDWRFYKCDNKRICAELSEVFGIDLGFDDIDENEVYNDPNIGTEKDILDVVHDEKNNFRLFLSDGNDITDTEMTAEQKAKLINFFENYELRDEDLVPDMWKGYGSAEFNEAFGEPFIMISNEERVEKDISVSKDMKYIALYSAGSYNEHGFDTRIYRLHDAEQLIGDIYDMLYGID